MARAAFETDLGAGAVVYDGDRVVAIELPADRPPDAGGEPPVAIRHLVDALEAYYGGRASLVVTPDMLDAAGSTPLLRAIYAHVAAIRPGRTATYGGVAAAVGRPGAARAVGAAMARNPFPPVIPCHRVVGAGGRLQGYGGGLHQKRYLLDMEAMDMEALEIEESNA